MKTKVKREFVNFVIAEEITNNVQWDEVMRNIKERLENMEDIMRKSNIYLIKSLGVANREREGVPKLETFMAENFSELMKSTNPQIQKHSESWG